jgi:hypothetical protein
MLYFAIPFSLEIVPINIDYYFELSGVRTIVTVQIDS